DVLHNVQGIGSGKRSTIPAFARNPNGIPGPLMRHCTRDYKIDPIIAKLRDLLAISVGRRVSRKPVVEQWIGISTDEAHRMKPSRKVWIEHRWPLIEERRSRWDCLRWLER